MSLEKVFKEGVARDRSLLDNIIETLQAFNDEKGWGHNQGLQDVRKELEIDMQPPPWALPGNKKYFF
ncbi:MAG: hypothetical protein V4437_01305 [Patescibacteria group bacterium]